MGIGTVLDVGLRGSGVQKETAMETIGRVLGFVGFRRPGIWSLELLFLRPSWGSASRM